MNLILLTMVLYILLILIVLCTKVYHDTALLEKIGSSHKFKAPEKEDNEDKIKEEEFEDEKNDEKHINNRIYDYDPEPGNDFTYDEHGNVKYGIGFCGAPRLPFYMYGMSPNKFIEKYTSIDKKYRIHFLENLDRNIYQVCPEVILICDFCKIFESDEDKQYLIIHLNRFAKNYLPRQVYGNQLKFFKDIIELLHIEQSKNSFKKVLADII
jgi:hypothetical protein